MKIEHYTIRNYVELSRDFISACGPHDVEFVYSAGRYGVLRYGYKTAFNWVSKNIVWC